ncbi:methyl-accepting chemotaxis sensory transducer [Chloroherpeton thalassium ATCC 35110]|uniref:Methyl-accepting chemotaxis sensory transducer n=1 Tax=Chloroherpeton thalassium (strain ATCC 35110 / GB-78) TaxID=517418 RepID=B3QWP3_CHLT3|nr:methyl-accepting chemotaxis protein [Chloroherpeton thalassium]ACF14803.1 methyl-accepting chemotaxis sensory transducer [Chloroherpeton thalassium ATCC 35110]
MVDLLSKFFSKNSVKGKLLRDFVVAISSTVVILGTLIIIAIYFLSRSQVEKATYEIENQGKDRLSEQTNILENTITQNLQQLENQVAVELGSEATFSNSLLKLDPYSNKSRSAEAAQELARQRLYEVSLETMVQLKLSMFTVLDKDGIVVTRATTPDTYGDDVFIRDYSKKSQLVSQMLKRVDAALTGNVQTGLEIFSADILQNEAVNAANAISGVTVAGKNTLADQALVPEQGSSSSEPRGLMLCTVQPIRSADGSSILGVAVAAQMLNQNPKLILQPFHNVIPSNVAKASISIGNIRVVTSETLPNGNPGYGYAIPEAAWKSLQREGTAFFKDASTGILPKAYAQYKAIRTKSGKPIGAITVATDYSYYARILADQEGTSTAIILYTIGIVIIVLLLGVGGGYFFSVNRAENITLSVDEIKNLMTSVLSGDFNARSNITSGDEFEELSVQFNEMIRRLSALIETETERDAMQKQLTDLLIVVSNSAEGDFTQRAVVTEGALGALADSFNLMVDDLGNLIREVQSAALQVGEAASEILSSTEQMAHGAEEQSVQVANASAAVEEMAASIRQVAMNADSASEAAQRATQVAQTGGKTVEETIEGMRRIRATVQDSSQKIKSLGESSMEISKIVQTIEDIANQTNLLALNATIEAARAGEAGRGFAVVADQVRELAERSSKATNDISQLVQTIQSETQDAVSAMERGTLEVERGTKLADSASRALDEIRNVVSQSTELIQEISLAAKQQDIASSGVVSAMTEVSQIAKQSLLGAKQSATLAMRLNEITQQLAKSVSRFKIPAGIFHTDKDGGYDTEADQAFGTFENSGGVFSDLGQNPQKQSQPADEDLFVGQNAFGNDQDFADLDFGENTDFGQNAPETKPQAPAQRAPKDQA